MNWRNHQNVAGYTALVTEVKENGNISVIRNGGLLSVQCKSLQVELASYRHSLCGNLPCPKGCVHNHFVTSIKELGFC